MARFLEKLSKLTLDVAGVGVGVDAAATVNGKEAVTDEHPAEKQARKV